MQPDNSNGRRTEQQWPATGSGRWRQVCRSAVIRSLYRSGLLSAGKRFASHYSVHPGAASLLPHLRREAQSKFGILCYHRVGTEGVPLYSRLEPAVFDAQMAHIKKHYRLVSLAQLCHELKDQCRVPPTLAVTFDDGYRDLYRYAFPVLRKYLIPATIYLIGDCVENGDAPWYDRIFWTLKTIEQSVLDVELNGLRRFLLSSRESRGTAAWEIVCFLRSIPDRRRRDWLAEFGRQHPVDEAQLANRMLSWEQVREMRLGGVEFGAHTMTHPAVSRLDESDLREELADSKHLIESRLQGPVVDFAFPFGKPEDISPAAQSYLAQCGYRSAVSTTEGYNYPGANPFSLRRMQIGDGAPIADFSLDLCLAFLMGQTMPDQIVNEPSEACVFRRIKELQGN